MLRVSLLALLLAAACGDNHAVTPDAGGPPDPGGTRAMVAAGGGSGGVLARLSTSSMAVAPAVGPTGVVGADPVMRHLGHELYVLDRATGVLSVLDDATLAVVDTRSPGLGARDVAAVGDKLYVPIATGAGVVVLAPGAQTTIDLSAADPDGVPDCMSALAIGTDVYVACALLDATGAPRGNAQIFVIDSATDRVRTSFALQSKNPIALLEAMGDGSIAVSTMDPRDGSGCVEKITTGEAPASACVLSNQLLAGHATRMQFEKLEDGSLIFWMAVPAADHTSTDLLAYETSSNELWPPISTPGETVGDVGLCPDGTVVLSELTAHAEGLRAYQEATEVTTDALPIALPPTSPHGIECY